MCFFFFFFKQKTAYEMRISDWSSDVCSSDLPCHVRRLRCAMLSADRVERNQQAAPQHIPLEWHTDFGGEEMAEASERQVALPGRVGKPDGACLDEPINRLRGSHDARIERSDRKSTRLNSSH